jgi:hypothetical protein
MKTMRSPKENVSESVILPGDDFQCDAFSDAERFVKGAAYNLQAKFGAILTKAQLQRLARRFHRLLSPPGKRGRKPSPRIDAAFRDFQCGLSIAQIAEIHTPGYRAMNAVHKKAVRKRLQAALRRRERQRRRELREMIGSSGDAQQDSLIAGGGKFSLTRWIPCDSNV